MKRILIVAIIFVATLTGCRTQKETTKTQASVRSDSVAAVISERAEAKIAESDDILMSSDSLGLFFSADSVRLGNIVVYKPELLAEAKGARLHGESHEEKMSVDSVSAQFGLTTAVASDSSSKVKQKASVGPSIWDIIEFAAFMVILCFACVKLRKFISNRLNT